MSTLKSLIKSLKLMERRLPLYLLAIFMMTALNALFEVAGSVFMKIIFDTASKSCDVNSGQEIIIAIVLGVMSIIFASVFMCIYNNEPDTLPDAHFQRYSSVPDYHRHPGGDREFQNRRHRPLAGGSPGRFCGNRACCA